MGELYVCVFSEGQPERDDGHEGDGVVDGARGEGGDHGMRFKGLRFYEFRFEV